MKRFVLLLPILLAGCNKEPDVDFSTPQYVKGYQIKYEKAYIDGALAGAEWRGNTPVIYITEDYYLKPEEVRHWVILHEYCHLDLRYYEDDEKAETMADCCAIKLLSTMWDNWVDEVVYWMQDTDPKRASDMLECYSLRNSRE